MKNKTIFFNKWSSTRRLDTHLAKSLLPISKNQQNKINSHINDTHEMGLSFKKLMSVFFHVSVLLFIMNFVITLLRSCGSTNQQPSGSADYLNNIT